MAKAKELPQGDTVEPPKKKSRFKLIMLLCSLLLLLGAVGGGGYWWLYLRPGSEGLSGLFSSSDSAAPSEASSTEGDGGSGGGGEGHSEQTASGGSTSGQRSTDPSRTRAVIKPVSLPTLTVNLADPSGARYLQIGMDVEVNAPEAAMEIEGQTARVRDAIILLLSSKRVEDIASAEGKILLKTEVAARLNQILGSQRIVRIYFTEFFIR